jgi:SNF2 family DNA or RNA helicase
MTEIKSKLLEYQIPHVDNLVNSLKKYNRCLDASDTGTGKTYSAIACAKLLGLKPFIICPKSVLSSWINVLEYFNCDYYGLSNYELIQNCKWYTKTTKNERIKCPYVKKIEKKNPKKKKKQYIYHWNFPTDTIVIFDEAHRCKNKKTLTSTVLFTLSQKPIKILMLSATIADKPETFEIAGYVLGLYNNLRHAKNWISHTGKDYENIMQGVNNVLYPDYASRMRIYDLKGLFPENSVKCVCLDMACAEEIEKEYKIIQEAVEELKKQESQTIALGKIIKARQRIELLRVPSFLKIIKDHLKNNLSVAVFVNFTNTLRTLGDELKTTCYVFGEQSLKERNKNINDFNEDRSRIIICNMRAGGVGISLHDTKGKYPRRSLISPSWSAIDMIQALGRIHRAKGMSPVEQLIIFCKGTVEEGICETIKEKIENIGCINDGNLESYKIQGLMDKQLNSSDELSEFEILFQKINTLNARKVRLLIDLKETDDEMKTLEFMINSLVQY